MDRDTTKEKRRDRVIKLRQAVEMGPELSFAAV